MIILTWFPVGPQGVRKIVGTAGFEPAALDSQARTKGLGRSGAVWREAAHHRECRMRPWAVWPSLVGVASLLGSRSIGAWRDAVGGTISLGSLWRYSAATCGLADLRHIGSSDRE